MRLPLFVGETSGNPVCLPIIRLAAVQLARTSADGKASQWIALDILLILTYRRASVAVA